MNTGNRNPSEIVSWEQEANDVCKDIQSCVRRAQVSEDLSFQSGQEQVYINIETLELRRITVKLSSRGYRIVGEEFDDNSLETSSPTSSNQQVTYETPYALLQSISPLYVSRFAEELTRKLEGLNTSF